MEVAWPPPLLAAPVVSYTTFSPLPLAGRSVSVALFAGCPARTLSGIVLCGARTFLRRPVATRDRPADPQPW